MDEDLVAVPTGTANGTWSWLLAELHSHRKVEGDRVKRPSMLAVDSHRARGASSGGTTFHDRGGKFGSAKGAKRMVAVDVSGLPGRSARATRVR